MTSISAAGVSTTTTCSGRRGRRSICTATPRSSTIKPFLAVLDNLEPGREPVPGRATDTGRAWADLQAVQRGARKLGVTEIPALGEIRPAVKAQHPPSCTQRTTPRRKTPWWSVPEGLHAGRQGSAVRHGEGNQLRKLLWKAEAVQEQHGQEDRRCMRRHREYFNIDSAGASGLGGVLRAGRQQPAGVYHRGAGHTRADLIKQDLLIQIVNNIYLYTEGNHYV